MDQSITTVTCSPAEPAQRRRSGRNTRPPQKFASVIIPSRISTHIATTPTSKRKRKADEDVDPSDVDNEDSGIVSGDSRTPIGSRTQRALRKTKKTAIKKFKINGRHNDTETHKIVKLPSRSKKITKKRLSLIDQDAESLHTELFSSVNTPQETAARWLQQYHEDSRQALADLVNLVLRSSGCNIGITVDDIDDVDNVDGRLVDVQNEFQMQNISEYPLTSRAKTNQSFRTKLTGFFDQLIELMHESNVLYEETILLENVHQWIAALSSSNTRPFRHTATVVALTMTSARCRIAHSEIETAAKVQRQLENEIKSKRRNKARLADFQRRVDKNNERKSILESQIIDYFQTVYLHRYRDIDPKIRLECIEALGTWIVSLESYFFDAQFLRYMGWMLSDTHGPMRQAVVIQLQKIMKTLNHGGIRHFIDRFRPRLIEMATRDSETTVRVHTIELLTLIRNAEMLEPDDINLIGRLIFDTEPRVRKTTVNFFISNVNNLYEIRLQELYGDEVQEYIANMMSSKEDFDSPRALWIKYKCLAEILVGYDMQDQVETHSQVNVSKFLNVARSESRFALAAHALFEQMPELKDWQVLTGYLLYDHTSSAKTSDSEFEHLLSEAVKPKESEEIVLLEILNAVVKLSLQHIDEPTKADRKKQSKAEMMGAKEVAARHLAPLIIRLLKKYGADPQSAKLVLKLVYILDFEFFHDELQQNSSICSRLLDEICTQFKSHADSAVLKQASLALLHARGYEELEEIASSKIQLMWEESVSMLLKISQTGEISIRGGTFSETLLADLSHNLARIEQLSSISNPIEFMEGDYGKEKGLYPITLIFDLIARGELVEGNVFAYDSLEDTIVQSAMRSGLFYFMWKTRDLATLALKDQEKFKTEIDQLRERQEIFTANLIASFSSRADLDDVRLLGAGTLLDLHVTFVASFGLVPAIEAKEEKRKKDNKTDISDLVSSLVKTISTEVQQELLSIFCELERQYARKSKKKLNTPDDDEAPEDLDSEMDEDNEAESNDLEKYVDTLTSEEQLCQFTGKLCLAILAQVIDHHDGPSSSTSSIGKLRYRLLRNRQFLGQNFKEMVACLDETKAQKAKKILISSKSKSFVHKSVHEGDKEPSNAMIVTGSPEFTAETNIDVSNNEEEDVDDDDDENKIIGEDDEKEGVADDPFADEGENEDEEEMSSKKNDDPSPPHGDDDSIMGD